MYLHLALSCLRLLWKRTMWSAWTRGRPLAKKDVVLGNDAIEILIELNLLTNFGAMNV